MQYTLGVLKEALRKYTVVPVVTRNLAADDELLGHKLPAGIMIACHLHVSELLLHCCWIAADCC
jgi:cytochrome P450